MNTGLSTASSWFTSAFAGLATTAAIGTDGADTLGGWEQFSVAMQSAVKSMTVDGEPVGETLSEPVVQELHSIDDEVAPAALLGVASAQTIISEDVASTPGASSQGLNAVDSSGEIAAGSVEQWSDVHRVLMTSLPNRVATPETVPTEPVLSSATATAAMLESTVPAPMIFVAPGGLEIATIGTPPAAIEASVVPTKLPAAPSFDLPVSMGLDRLVEFADSASARPEELDEEPRPVLATTPIAKTDRPEPLHRSQPQQPHQSVQLSPSLPELGAAIVEELSAADRELLSQSPNSRAQTVSPEQSAAISKIVQFAVPLRIELKGRGQRADKAESAAARAAELGARASVKIASGSADPGPASISAAEVSVAPQAGASTGALMGSVPGSALTLVQDDPGREASTRVRSVGPVETPAPTLTPVPIDNPVPVAGASTAADATHGLGARLRAAIVDTLNQQARVDLLASTRDVFTARVSVDPVSLGQVQIEVTRAANGALEVMLVATHHEAASALKGELDDLVQELVRGRLETAKVTVRTANDTQADGDRAQRQHHEAGGQRRSSESAEERQRRERPRDREAQGKGQDL